MELDYGLFQTLIDSKKQILYKTVKTNISGKNFELIKKSYQVAAYAHYSQKRKSGEPYISHPIEVATIIASWGLDYETVAASLLHDVVEDTFVTKGELSQIFGPSVAELVDGVTKLDKIHFESEEIAHAEYFQKVVLAMSKDVRVILIKLADRVHNMMTLASMKIEKRKKIALETMEIYVPIANRIGLHKVHLQLADECFKYLYPLRYKVLSKAVNEAQQRRFPIVQEILNSISNALKSNAVNAKFVYKQRTIYNLYRRMVRRKQSFNRIYDIFEIKIIVNNIRDCYLTLGVLHSVYRPLPGKFKDYIAIPKINGYQSLHSTLMGPYAAPIQVHIRTEEMDEVAESGIISHWIRAGINALTQKTAPWINNILDIQLSSFSAKDFMESIKQDLSPGDVYTFSPKGKIIILPQGATPIDFAYYIHSDIGNHCHSVLINQKLSRLNTKLNNGDIVEIITEDDAEPQSEWLNYAVSGKAISKIKQYFKEQKYDEDVSIGFAMLKSASLMFDLKIELNDHFLQKFINQHYPKQSLTEFQHNIGNGNIPVIPIMQQIANAPLELVLSKCNMPFWQDDFCLALPGDVIVAKINRNLEIFFHHGHCKVAKKLGLESLNEINLINDIKHHFRCKIRVSAGNKPGVFAKLAAKLAEKEINIEEILQESNIYNAQITFTLSIIDLKQLENLISKLLDLEFVEHVIRL